MPQSSTPRRSRLTQVSCVLSFLAFTLTGVGAFAAEHAASHPPHWTYSADTDGPSHWAELDPAFEACDKGMNQSPIDIHNAMPTRMAPLEFNYGTESPVVLVNNGHTVQVNIPAGSSLNWGEDAYTLLQFHFHTPSEEALNGKRTPMEIHFVHRNASGGLAVVAALIQTGKANAAAAPLFAHLPRAGESITVDQLVLNLSALLPAKRAYYAYDGSLTTPPCSEAVRWLVLKNPIYFSADQVQAFRAMIGENARPLQSLNGRMVRESDD
jgi:carbonic anhydrase